MPSDADVEAVLLDIEGTTTPVEFVHQVLFPYARERVEGFLKERLDDAEGRAAAALLRAEQEADGDAGPLADYARRLIDQDRKSTGLKALQGMIWERGYLSGELRGAVYPDVPRAFARWTAQGRRIAIFSSGSVLAQRLLFRHSHAGDLASWPSAWFDTTTGPKKEEKSYRLIAQALGLAPAKILFISDTAAELDAARAAGLRTAHCVRPGGPPAAAGTHRVIGGLDEVLP